MSPHFRVLVRMKGKILVHNLEFKSWKLSHAYKYCIFTKPWCPLTCRLWLYNFISSCVRNANEDTHVNWWQRWMAMISIVTQALWHSFGLCSSCMGSLTVSSPGGFVWIYWRSVNFRMTFWCLKFSKKTTQKFDEFLP